MISSSVYSSIELRAKLTIFHTFSVFIHFSYRFAISFTSLFSYASSPCEWSVLFFFFGLVSSEVFAVLLKLVLCCYFKAFSNNRLFVIYHPFLVLACFQYDSSLSMILVNKASIWAFVSLCIFVLLFYKCALLPIDFICLVDILVIFSTIVKTSFAIMMF